MEKIIQHQAIESKWLSPNLLGKPKTLVLGSFNPFEKESECVDYFYGRNTNHFWKAIASIIGENDDYFFDPKNGFEEKKKIMQDRFCCFDVIDSIEFKCDDDILLQEFIEKEIYANYLDQRIWTSKTKYKKQQTINIIRKYNESLLDFVNYTDSITKIIHTMGENRWNEKEAKPKENKNEFGFGKYISSLKKICVEKNIEIIYKSFSPSGYAVNSNKTDRNELENWLKVNLNLDENQPTTLAKTHG